MGLSAEPVSSFIHAIIVSVITIRTVLFALNNISSEAQCHSLFGNGRDICLTGLTGIVTTNETAQLRPNMTFCGVLGVNVTFSCVADKLTSFRTKPAIGLQRRKQPRTLKLCNFIDSPKRLWLRMREERGDTVLQRSPAVS